MKTFIAQTKDDCGREAAAKGAGLIRSALQKKNTAGIILATGASQFDMLLHLQNENLDWQQVSGFHLDEYIGISKNHPASFRKYLKDRFVDDVPLKAFHYIEGDENPEQECNRLAQIIAHRQIDVAFIGIGENGHLAFNDPPADFATKAPFIVVELDEACRRQQMGEGWFDRLADVPKQAISMSINQIMKAKNIICTVPDARKAGAVKQTIEAEISPMVPATILRRHPSVFLYLDQYSAASLKKI